MNRKFFFHVFLLLGSALAASSAQAFSFSLAPVTFTGPTNPNQILVNGTVTVGAGETFYSPSVMSTTHLPFKAGFTAGFNGSGQMWHPAFAAWNGLGTYTGPIFCFQVSSNNLGYSAGMPQGMYDKNLLAPGGNATLVLNYAAPFGATMAASAPYAIQVVPEPASISALALGALALIRRKIQR